MKCRKCPVIAECQVLGLTVEKPGSPTSSRGKVCPLLWVVHKNLADLKEEGKVVTG